MNKSDIYFALYRKAMLILKLRELERETPISIFMDTHEVNKIFINDEAWNTIIHILQPNVRYNPEGIRNDVEPIYSYFYLDIAGDKWKIYTLLDGGNV